MSQIISLTNKTRTITFMGRRFVAHHRTSRDGCNIWEAVVDNIRMEYICALAPWCVQGEVHYGADETLQILRGEGELRQSLPEEQADPRSVRVARLAPNVTHIVRAGVAHRLQIAPQTQLVRTHAPYDMYTENPVPWL